MASDRYIRQQILPEIGPEGQARLEASRVLVAGVGALGCVSADLLARAGVGSLLVVDRDVVERNNLQRQMLFDDGDVDRPKAEVAAEKLRRINPEIRVEGRAKDLNFSNVEELVQAVDLVVDGTDNIETRLLLNEACIRLRKPFVYAGAIGTTGMVLAVRSPETACFRCFVRGVPPPGTLPTCDTAGILNSAAAAVGSIQTSEALKLLLARPPTGRLLVYDGWDPQLQSFAIPRRSDCPACVRGEFEILNARRPAVVASLCGSDTVSIDPLRRDTVDLDGLESRLRAVGSVRRLGSVLLFEGEGLRITIFPDGRALIRGVQDPDRAKSVYAKYVGG